MLPGRPVTPAEAVDRLRRIADEHDAGYPFDSADATELRSLADVLKPAETAETDPAALCGKTGRRTAPCDRPAGHDDDCSWESVRIKRLYRDYETDALRLPGVERERDRWRLRAERAQQRIAALEAAPFWRRLLGSSE